MDVLVIAVIMRVAIFNVENLFKSSTGAEREHANEQESDERHRSLCRN